MNSRFQSAMRVGYLVIAWAYVAAILLQVLLIGLNLFAGQLTRSTHVDLGHMVGVFPLLMVVLAFAGRMCGGAKGLAALQFGLFALQSEVFAAIRGVVPTLAAFHPVLALVVFAVAVYVAQRARAWARSPVIAPAPAGQVSAERSVH